MSADYRTRANHHRGPQYTSGGFLTLRGEDDAALVFRAHPIFQKRYEVRLPVTMIRTFSITPSSPAISNTMEIVMTTGERISFVIPKKSAWREHVTAALGRHGI